MTPPTSKAKPAHSKASEQAGTRPAFTISEAEVATGASRSTLRRRLAEQAFPNAYTSGKTKQWRIPVEDLLAAGLKVNAPTPGEGQQAAPAQRPDDGLAQRVVDLERALAVEQARRAAAEQLAEERAERVEDLRSAMRLLEVGPLGAAQQAERQAEQPAEPPRRGWFSRRT